MERLSLMGIMETIFGGLILLSLIVIYFIPVIIAVARRHPQQNSITLLTVFAGWTGVGWIIALVWSATNFQHARRAA